MTRKGNYHSKITPKHVMCAIQLRAKGYSYAQIGVLLKLDVTSEAIRLKILKNS